MAYDIEKAAQKLADNVEGFETRTLQRIGKRIKQTGQLNSVDIKALENMANIGIPLQEIYKDLADTTALNIKEIKRILSEHMTAEMERKQSIFNVKGVPFIPYSENEFAQQMVQYWAEITAGEMVNLSRTKAIGFTRAYPNGRSEFITIEGAFQQAIDKAVVAVRAGTTDFNTAMRDTIADLGGSGIVVNYGSGVTRRLDSMVRQNLLYGAKQSAQAYHNHVGEELGTDGFEVDYHSHPRPSHEAIGGRIFALGDKDVTIEGVTYTSAEKDLEGNGSALDLLGDYGCLHFATPFFLGISQPRHDNKWLEEQKAKDKEVLEYITPAGNVIKGTRYDFTQRQRALERGVRENKRKEITAKAAGNNILAKEARDKINALRSSYDDLCSKIGLQPTKERMAVSWDSRKYVDNNIKNDIIKENGKKNITPITDKAIENVPKVDIKGFTDEQNTFIQQQHSELLKYARDNNESKEVAFVFEKGLAGRSEYIGADNKLDFGTSLLGKGNDLFVMHNHPRNSSYSTTDLIFFRDESAVKTFTIAKNNSNVEYIIKSDSFDADKFKLEFDRLYKKIVINDTDAEKNRFVKTLLNKTKAGVIWSEKK